MGLFGSDGEDHTAVKLEAYADLIKDRETELQGLKGLNTANAKVRSKELRDEIRQAKINMAEAKDSAERAGDDIGAYQRGRDLF